MDIIVIAKFSETYYEARIKDHPGIVGTGTSEAAVVGTVLVLHSNEFGLGPVPGEEPTARMEQLGRTVLANAGSFGFIIDRREDPDLTR